MITIQTPYVQFTELDGSPLDDGAVYIGTAGLNPQTNPITVYWDNAGTQPAAQPLTTRSGVIARNGAPARVYISASSYSLMVRDKRGSLVASELSITADIGTDNITDGAVTISKLESSVASLVNDALQRSGGTMTGKIVLDGDATLALHPVTKQQLYPAVVPGAVQAFAMSSAPTGWLKANGAAVSRTTYATLFAAIGTAFGAGDGSTTFNLPDLRGEFIRGWDDGRGVDTGRAFGSGQGSDNKRHNHTVKRVAIGASDGGTPEVFYADTSRDSSTYSDNFGTADSPINVSGGDEARPRNVALLYCIKF